MSDTIYKYTFEHKGHTFTARHVADYDHGPPWEDYDGHGVIVASRDRDDDAPQGRYRSLSLQSDWYYDMHATREVATRDQWGIAPEKAKGLTQTQITEAAIEADYQFLRGWACDEWSYVGVDVSHVSLPGEHESLWGIESNADAYLKEVAKELADQLFKRLPAELDAQIAKLQAVRNSLEIGGANMRTYIVSCLAARPRGAIGIFTSIAQVIDAETAAQAEQLYNDSYERNRPLTVIDLALRWRITDTWNGGTLAPKVVYESKACGVPGHNECFEWILKQTPFSFHNATTEQGYTVEQFEEGR